QELLEIRPLPRREGDVLGLLKRAFLLCRQSGDFGLLSVMSDRALSAQGGSAAVRLVAAYSYLRAGRLSDAEKVARAGLPAGFGDVVRGEIALRRGQAWHGSDSLTRELVELETSRSAADFAAAARDVEDDRLALDAALLYLQAGDISSARRTASLLHGVKYDEVAGLIAYDAGDFPAAVARLTRTQVRPHPRADIALILADCYHALGRGAELDASLLDAITIDPRASWTPYADLASGAAKRGDIPFARSMLERGRAIFPESRELVLATARLEARQGNSRGAVALLDALVAERADDGQAALLRLTLTSPGKPPQWYRAELWKLFNRLPSDREVFATLAAALIASNDWADAAAELRLFENAAGSPDADTLSIRALVQVMQGKEDLAIDSFRSAAESGGGGWYRYDLAVVLLHRGRAQEALEQLAEAERESAPAAAAASSAMDPDDMSGDRFLARIELLKGRSLLATGDVAGARGAFLRAHVLDPHQLRSGLELRKLEARGLQ
ncbi:MAG TPA: tetratricopeptide repeat protein, partial [Spirochaetia bacterium]|nr:tetratricopeptide repeat protein [Spirochaetia bacterium]